MDWTQVFVILGVFAAFFVYLLSKIDKLKNEIQADLRNQNIHIQQDLKDHTIQLRGILAQLNYIKGQLMPKVIHLQEEKPKKKAKGE